MRLGAIVRKEFLSYFQTPIAHVFIVFFYIVTGFLFFRDYFLNDQATLRPFFGLIPVLFLVLIPALTMRMWAEEAKQGTMEVLLTLPTKDWEVVVGKWLASFAFLALVVALSFPYVITVFTTFEAGNAAAAPDIGPIVGGYVGTLLLGAAYLSIGIFISSLAADQIIAFIISTAAVFALYIVGTPFITTLMPELWAPTLEYIGLATHFESVQRGVLDSRDIIYYLTFVVMFLFLTMRSVSSRKWKA